MVEKSASLDPKPLQCAYVYTIKNRPKRCCHTLKANSTGQFCTTHQLERVSTQDMEECPYEPGLFMTANKMRLHLKVCPKFVQLESMKAQPFYKFNINMPKT